MAEYLCHPLGDFSQDPNYSYYSYPGHTSGAIQDTSLDYNAPEGTPVYAMMNGVIAWQGTDYGGGNMIKLKSTDNSYSRISGNPLYLRYMHLSQILVKTDQVVKTGDLIGYSGNTGAYTTGAHLHLDMSINGNNPLQYPPIDGTIMTHLIPGYDYEANRVRTVRNYDGGAGIPFNDNYYYHLIGSPVIWVTKQSNSNVPPEGGILYEPLNTANEKGGTMTPAYTDAYGNLSMSKSFMGDYPNSIEDIKNNKGLQYAYLICKHEFGENEEGMSYAKLLRARILYHRPAGSNTSYVQPGATLATYCQWWNNQSWCPYDVITEANQKTDWNLDFAQKVYNNIRYGPAYGLTSDHTIKGFQACPFENSHISGHPAADMSAICNLAPNIEYMSGLYYVMYSTYNFLDVTHNEANPAVIPQDQTDHEEINGAHYFNGLIVVNKSYPMSVGAINAVGGIRQEVSNAYEQMRSAWASYAAAHGINEPMSITSGFRTYQDQQNIYNSYPPSDRDTYSARPGHSEHHTGYAIDITLASSDPYSGYVARYPNQSKWLAEHCAEFGFIIRYPLNKENITGYIYEPWHVRYVGIEWAQKLKNTTMEEYFGIDSKY